MFWETQISDLTERLKTSWENHSKTSKYLSTYAGNIYQFVQPVAAWKDTPGTARATFKLHVDISLCNPAQNLHGGASGTIFDILTSYAIGAFSKEGFWELPGVSQSLSMTYLRPAMEGTDCFVDCHVVHIGKRTCTIRAEIRAGENGEGEILVTCEHLKANIDPPKI